MSVTLPGGAKTKARKWYAGFKDGKQVTRWYRSIDKAWSVARRVKCSHINKRLFIDPPAETA